MSDDSGSEESSDVQVIKQIAIQFCNINILFEINWFNNKKPINFYNLISIKATIMLNDLLSLTLWVTYNNSKIVGSRAFHVVGFYHIIFSFYYLETYFKIIINILKIILSRYILNKTKCIRKKLISE